MIITHQLEVALKRTAICLQHHPAVTLNNTGNYKGTNQGYQTTFVNCNFIHISNIVCLNCSPFCKFNTYVFHSFEAACTVETIASMQKSFSQKCQQKYLVLTNEQQLQINNCVFTFTGEFS